MSVSRTLPEQIPGRRLRPLPLLYTTAARIIHEVAEFGVDKFIAYVEQEPDLRPIEFDPDDFAG